MRYSTLTDRVAGEGADAWAVHSRAVGRARAGDDIFLLSIGDPDFDTPAPIRRAAIEALERGRTHYSPVGGEPELKLAIADSATSATGVTVSPDQVIVFPGAQAALFAVTQCLFDGGDEVIVAEPTYVTYPGVFGAPRVTLVSVGLRPEDGFRLDPDRVRAAVTPRTRGIVLNFPHNPTGACLTEETALAVADLCRRHDLWLISDEVYASLMFGGRRHLSPFSLPEMASRTVVVSSLSKSHAMTGWRCGWAIGPEPLARHLVNLGQAMFFGIAQFVQDAAVVAIRSGGDELDRIRASYQRRAAALVDVLRGAPGLSARMPDAGMYLFADVRPSGMSGKRFASRLLDATDVSVTPGEGFGPSGAGHVRITLGCHEDRLAEAGRRIRTFASAGGAVEAGR
ncbi:MAG: aminotransferase class I/II-fold pyridoxal phosphate-dependent enzyme [Gemmatimonadetes bacterium]|nr:aminotransferase class I/II-fold pyridoxal phosphate-dependent enzyme [Gemmatimonadota bacterium]